MFAKKSAPYSCLQSLTCAKWRVEKALTLGVVGTLFLGAGLAAESARAERFEPEPLPQNAIREGASEYQEARKLLQERKWAEAVIVLRSQLRREPDAIGIRMDLARALAFTGRREEALSTLEQALSREKKGAGREAVIRRIRVLSRMFFSNDSFQLHQDGFNLMASAKYRAARERLERALGQEPDNVEALLRLGQCLVLEQDDDSAAERLKFARKLNAYEPEIRLWLGRAMQRRGELQEALEELRAARRELPGSERAVLWLAEALQASGQRSLAIQLMEEDVSAHPRHISVLISLARTRTATASKDAQALWAARKDLQLALSRLVDFGTAERTSNESELGFEIQSTSEELREDIQKLLQQLDGKIQKQE